jgi:hypothetical protein
MSAEERAMEEPHEPKPRVVSREAEPDTSCQSVQFEYLWERVPMQGIRS